MVKLGVLYRWGWLSACACALTMVMVLWVTSLRSPRVLDGDRMVRINHRVGPDYYLDRDLYLCFAHYGHTLLQLDEESCQQLMMAHTDIGELPGEAIGGASE